MGLESDYGRAIYRKEVLMVKELQMRTCKLKRGIVEATVIRANRQISFVDEWS